MIKLIVVGKIKEKYLVNMIEDYYKRINKYHNIEIIEVIDSNKEEEGLKILSKVSTKSKKIALAINGKKYTSLEFSKLIENTLMHDANIDFIIGGSDGLSNKVIENCDSLLSFSDLTFPHGLFRGILLEQIYRAFKIINNETYHK